MKNPDILDRIDADIEASITRLTELLKIPSISTDPAYKEACQSAADWLVRDLAALGVEAEARQGLIKDCRQFSFAAPNCLPLVNGVFHPAPDLDETILCFA